MNEWLTLSATLLAGAALGLIFFGGLWWTVRRGLASQRAALWFFGSLLLRTAIVIGGLMFVCGDDWQRWIAALLGFIVARLLVTRVTRRMPPLMEARHAP